MIQEAEAKEPVTFVSLSSEQIEAIRKAMPGFSPLKIAAGTYRSLDKDYNPPLGLQFCGRTSRSPERT
jgi:TRAP-type uncharacterized transport system substrate-binding protein